MTDDEQSTAGCAIVSLIVICLFLAVAVATGDFVWKKEAVRHGAAHYDATSGAFTWNDEAQSEASK